MQQSWGLWYMHSTLLSLLKRLLPYRLTGLVFLLLLSGCGGTAPVSKPGITHPTPVPTPSVYDQKLPPIADTWNNIHLFLSFDYDISNPASIAKHYDFVWGAKVNTVRALRAGNPHIFITYYISFFRDTGVFGNDEAFHSLSYWKSVHPDWVLYRCDRTTPAYEFGNPNVPLDITNPAVIAWQVQTYAEPASKSGYDGIAADNVSLQNLSGACGSYVNGRWKQRYTGQVNDPQWSRDVITWLARMQQALHQLQHPLALIPNLSFANPNDAFTQQAVNDSDGVLDESGFTGFGDTYLTDADWVQLIQFIESVQQQHKPYYIVNQFPLVGPFQVQWAVASYLMAKEHSSAVYISTIQGYGGNLWSQLYDIPIGDPTNSMYRIQGIYARNYSHGLILVNASSDVSYTMTLHHKYSDLYGTSMSGTITMPPHSGLVLLSI